MRDELIGHCPTARLHGGVISACLDLRRAAAPHFDLTATVLRLGSRVATVRMAFCAQDGRPLSCGSAAYIVA